MKVNDMKLLILSDTHRSLGFAYDAIEKEHPDAVVHLGDHLTDAEDLSFACQEPDFYYVPGNCDYAPTVPQSLTLELDGVRIFVTHGHLYGRQARSDRACGRGEGRGRAACALRPYPHPAPGGARRYHAPEPRHGRRFGHNGYAVVEIKDGAFSCRLETDTE